MNSDNKRIIICIPTQPNLHGLMTLENAKKLAEEKCPNNEESASIIILDNNKDIVACLERINGNWTEKEIKEIFFTNSYKHNGAKGI